MMCECVSSQWRKKEVMVRMVAEQTPHDTSATPPPPTALVPEDGWVAAGIVEEFSNRECCGFLDTAFQLLSDRYT